MTLVLDILSWAFLLSGAFFSIVGGIGIIRLPEFFSRLHGGGITDTLGAGLIIVGLMLQVEGDFLSAFLPAAKLLMILFFMLITSPTACHALAKAALAQGLEPQLDSKSKKSTS